MPNTFANLNVPASDSVIGTPFDVQVTGRPKTLVLDGAVKPGGRYIVEGSTNGGLTWDVLVGLDGTQGFFTNDNAGAKTIDTIVSQVRVRSEANGIVPAPPSITLGAPPALGINVFRDLPVPPANGFGPVVDLGDSAGAFKTIVLRQGAGPIPAGSRYSVLASMDGVKFDEAMFFTADRQGARPAQIMCRFMRILRNAGGAAPIVSVGAEGLATGTAGTGCAISCVSLEDERTVANEETLIAEWMVDFDTLASLGATLGAVLTGIGRVEAPGQRFELLLFVGGTIKTRDGLVVAEIIEDPGDVVEHVLSIHRNFPRPSGPVPVKLTMSSSGPIVGVAHLRSVQIQFTCPGPID
jgi:hypothetical protein